MLKKKSKTNVCMIYVLLWLYNFITYSCLEPSASAFQWTNTRTIVYVCARARVFKMHSPRLYPRPAKIYVGPGVSPRWFYAVAVAFGVLYTLVTFR